MEEPLTVIYCVYTSYTPSQERAIKKYQSLNKEKIALKQKEYYQKKKCDPEFILRCRERNREYYRRKCEQADNKIYV